MRSGAIRDAVILLAATGILTVFAYNGRYGASADLGKIHDLITTEAAEETEMPEIAALTEEAGTELRSTETVSEEENAPSGFIMYSSIWDKVQMTFYEDGSCVFEMPEYSVKEDCTWAYQDGVLTVTREDGVVFTSYIAENVQSLKLDYQAMIHEELIGQFDSLDYKTFFEKE